MSGFKNTLSDLDGDDRFLIRTLYHNGLPISDIAKKRLTNETLVEAVLHEFEKNASEQVKKKKFRQASFWFFQHQKYILQGQDYAKLNFSLKRCERDWPNFGKFLEGETEADNITDTSKWAEVETLWNKTFQNYSSPSTGETSNVRFESRTGQAGSGLLSIDTEEQYMDAVCKITLNKENHSGSFLQIGSKLGILTFNSLLTTKEQCARANVQFEKIDGDVITVQLRPDEMFKTSKELGTTFIACETKELNNSMKPLSKMGKVEENSPIYTYFHYNGKQKVHMQQKILTIQSKIFHFDGKFKKGCVGAPLYCHDQLIGMAQGKTMKSGQNQAISIKAINEWLKKEMQTVSAPQFDIGEEVMATWTDGFPYKAIIRRKTDIGYQVHYYQFGEIMENQAIDTIKKMSTPTKIVQPEISQTYATTTTTTTTTSTRTTTTSPSPTQPTTPPPPSTTTNPTTSPPPMTTTVTELHGNKGEKTSAWLKNLGMERYENAFLENEYYLDDMINWTPEEIETMLQKANVKAGAIMKFQKVIKEKKGTLKPAGVIYVQRKSLKDIMDKKIKSIENVPMPDGWKPSKADLDLSSEFQKPDGNYSIRYGCQKIANGYIPLGLIKGTDQDIYVLSSRFNKYFKISITWKDGDAKKKNQQ